jgi:hypothetical protein
MVVDTLTRLCGTGQAITATTAGVFSTAWLDRGASTYANIGGGRLVVARFCSTVAFNSATENATIRLQIVAVPKNSMTTTTTLTAFDSTTDVDAATETITATAHGLTNGTRVTVAAATGALPTGLAASTSYYIKAATTNTFQLSLTPDGAAVDLTDAVGTTTVTWYPEVLVQSDDIGVDRMQAGEFQLELAVPPPQTSPRYPYNRYLFARFVPSATITAGTITCDLHEGWANGTGIIQPIGYTTA